MALTTVNDQVLRVTDILQEANTAGIAAAHQEALQRLARLKAFTQIVAVVCVSQKAVYRLPSAAVRVDYVLFNDRALRYASERTIERRFQGAYERGHEDPVYWTTDNQEPGTFRVVPVPRDSTGSFTVFYTEDVSVQAVRITDELPTFLDWEDTLVYDTARQLAERDTESQNLPVAELCKHLLALWEDHLDYYA